MKGKPSRTPRLHVEEELRPGTRLVLPAEAAHHAARVLRLGAGDALMLFDGRGGEYEARILALERGRATVAVGAHQARERESPLAVILVQGISSGEKMDFTIQKAVELGVASIRPVLTGKSIVRLSAERGRAKAAHWRRIAISACEQCGRNRIPDVREARELGACLQDLQSGAPRVLLAADANETLGQVAGERTGAIVLAAGPEAGFSAVEEALLVRAGFVRVRLGPRVLRTETAALAALAALNALRGDF